MPSDFGAVYDYALALEASIPPAAMAELEAIRPACLGLTKKQKEEAARAAAAPAETHPPTRAAEPAPKK